MGKDIQRSFVERMQGLREAELDEILKAVVLRYSQLLPEHELVCLFLPKYNAEERQRILSRVEDAVFGQNSRHRG